MNAKNSQARKQSSDGLIWQPQERRNRNQIKKENDIQEDSCIEHRDPHE